MLLHAVCGIWRVCACAPGVVLVPHSQTRHTRHTRHTIPLMTFMWGLTIGVAVVAGGAAWVASATANHTFRWTEGAAVPEGCLRTGAEWALRTVDVIQHGLQKTARISNKFMSLGSAMLRDSAGVIHHRHKHKHGTGHKRRHKDGTEAKPEGPPAVVLDDDDLAP